MGVISLWQLLEPVRQTRSLPELKGQKIAIDLSAWIMGCKRVAVASGFRNVYLRTIFLRTLDLLKCGILPVFVCDGCIPKIKFDKIRSRCKGQSFGKSGPIFRERSQSDTTQICRHLFECLGLPCLESEGEGEALCAFLNKEQIVDGCLTSDSDVLLYGARKVYRNYTKKNKVGYLEAYDANDIHDQMKLDQRALVVLALLLGCDYNQMGVPGVGIKTAVRMVREMQQQNIDLLQRMLSWRTNQELQDLQEQMDIFNEEKHCKECLHIVVSHSQSGCDLCGDNINVSEDLEGCECSCHSFLQTFVSHEEEFKVRQKALLDPNFPSQEVIEEFLIPTESKDLKADVSWHEPNFADLQRIIKKRQKNYQLVYEVEWSKTSEDIWTKDATYICSVDRDLFRKCFPEMVKFFEESLLPAKTAEGIKKTISNLSHRVTRSVLKKHGLTLSDLKDKSQDLDNCNDETGTDQHEMSVRQSKRIIESCNKQTDSIPKSLAGIKKRKVKPVGPAETQNGRNVSDQMFSSKYFNLIGVCTVMLERIPSVSGVKAAVQSLSVNKELALDGDSSLRDNSEEIDCVEGSKASSSKAEEIENSLNGRNRKMETSNSIKKCFDGVGVMNVNSNGMDSIVESSSSKDVMMEGSNGSDSIVEGSKRKDVMMDGSNGRDSIVEVSSCKDVMMEGSNGSDSIVEGSNSKDVIMGGSNGRDSTVECSKSKDVMMEGLYGRDSIVGGSSSKDVMMEGSNGRDSIVEGSKSEDMMEGSNGNDSIVEGSSSKDVMFK